MGRLQLGLFNNRFTSGRAEAKFLPLNLNDYPLGCRAAFIGEYLKNFVFSDYSMEIFKRFFKKKKKRNSAKFYRKFDRYKKISCEILRNLLKSLHYFSFTLFLFSS